MCFFPFPLLISTGLVYAGGDSAGREALQYDTSSIGGFLQGGLTVIWVGWVRFTWVLGVWYIWILRYDMVGGVWYDVWGLF